MSNENGHNARSVTFTDRFSRQWDVTLTLASARRVDASDFSELWKGSVSFLEPSKELFTELITNRPLAMAVVWAICSKQAKEQYGDEFTEEDFIEGLDGSSMEEAIDGLWETLSRFFPQAKTALSELQAIRKDMIAKATAGLAKISDRAKEEIGKEIETLLATAEQELDDEYAKRGEKSTQVSDA